MSTNGVEEMLKKGLLHFKTRENPCQLGKISSASPKQLANDCLNICVACFQKK